MPKKKRSVENQSLLGEMCFSKSLLGEILLFLTLMFKHFRHTITGLFKHIMLFICCNWACCFQTDQKMTLFRLWPTPGKKRNKRWVQVFSITCGALFQILPPTRVWYITLLFNSHFLSFHISMVTKSAKSMVELDPQFTVTCFFFLVHD